MKVVNLRMAVGLYRILLAAYPPAVRREYGREMIQAFSDQYRHQALARGGVGAFRVWSATLRDLAASAPAEWWDACRPPRRAIESLRESPRRESVFDTLRSDVLFALRGFRKRPGFTAVAMGTIALGIGANSAIFSVVNGVLLRPLPFAAPDRIAYVWESNLARGWERYTASPANFVDWQEQSSAFETLAAVSGGSQTLIVDGDPHRVSAGFVSAGLFGAVLGVPPLLGRDFVLEENEAANAGVAILSHALWAGRFGADSSVIGRAITLDGNPVEILGVMPADFGFQPERDIWRPLTFPFDVSQARGAHYLTVLGRLADGADYPVAATDMESVASRLAQAFPATNEGWSAKVVPIHEQMVGDVRGALVVLLAVVGAVLLIACANVANLLLSLATTRRREMALRAALGAGRGRLVRQLLTESVLLAAAGGTVGLAMAIIGLRGLVALDPGTVPRLSAVGLDGTVLVFTAAVAGITGIVFGLAPAWQSARATITGSLRAGDHRTGGATRNALLVLQIGIAVVLAVASTLLVRSFQSMRAIDPGFRSDGVVVMRVRPPQSVYPDEAALSGFYSRVLERLSAVPGLMGVAETTAIPLFGSMGFSFTIAGREEPADADRPSGNMRVVSGDYFRVLGIPLRRGRTFTPDDRAGSPNVVVINEALARRYFPGEDPLGAELMIRSGNAACPCRVIGVVGDVKQGGLTGASEPGYYLPSSQSVWRSRILVAQAGVEPAAAIEAMRAVIRAADPTLAVYGVQTLEDRLGEAVATPRFHTTLVVIFAGLALGLASVGIYGVMSYVVGQRTRELGIRVALGATGGSVARLVLGWAMALTAIGIAAGVLSAVVATRFIESMLFGVAPTDPLTYAIVVALLGTVALVAAHLPARRAAAADPAHALRPD